MTQIIPPSTIQTFTPKGGPANGRKALPLLRKALERLGLDGFLVPHEDEYNNEYVPASADRLAWVTGFTGSAGAAIVMRDRAAVFTDGRYTLQVRAQVDGELFSFEGFPEPGLAGWIAANGRKGEVIGYDARLHSPDAIARIEAAAARAGVHMRIVDPNPVDTIWADRPPAPRAKINPHPVTLAGRSVEEKLDQIAKIIQEAGADAAVLTDPVSVAWILNLRGHDVACAPIGLGRAIIRSDGSIHGFFDPEKQVSDVYPVGGNKISIEPEDSFDSALTGFAGKTVMVDPAIASAHVFNQLEKGGATVKRAPDPVALPRAIKNAVEIEGSRRAHIRDGAAMVRFLHWLDTEAQSGNEDEISAAVKLETIRRALPDFRDISFETISGAGPNGALPHYRVSTETVRKISPGTLYLVDSGGQYPDGTTDITRTVPIGEPDAEMRRAFTLVLKGHIALARIRFPEGTTGSQLDALARQPLWMAGMDYDHGTGHGVGSYLSVHEGPGRIAKAPNTIALKPGMIFSNEPGFYKTGHWGIRIETLQVVTPPEDLPGGERPMMGFETLTLAPIHTGLLDMSLMSAEDRDWLNIYHAAVLEKVGPLVADERQVHAWLTSACKPV
ncbi:MAG: aminopeptidase P family protein [Caulobacterales bacterium]|uniref:aminopeptidase P family protein n=1 Tax=Glycocaulis sp. TaxID=1969725 RepID=UPI003F9FB9B5